MKKASIAALLLVVLSGCTTSLPPAPPVADSSAVRITDVLDADDAVWVVTWQEHLDDPANWTFTLDGDAASRPYAREALYGHPVGDQTKLTNGRAGIAWTGGVTRAVVGATVAGGGDQVEVETPSSASGESTYRSHSAGRNLHSVDNRSLHQVYFAYAFLPDGETRLDLTFEIDRPAQVVSGGRLLALFASDFQGTGVVVGRPSAHMEGQASFTIADMPASYTAVGHVNEPWGEVELSVFDPHGDGQGESGLATVPGEWQVHLEAPYVSFAGATMPIFGAIMDLPTV